jgi:hypothetical protein
MNAAFPTACDSGCVRAGGRADRLWSASTAGMAELRSQQELSGAAGTSFGKPNRVANRDLLAQRWGRWPPKLLLRSLYCFCHIMLRSRENPSGSSWHVKRQSTPTQYNPCFQLVTKKVVFFHTSVPRNSYAPCRVKMHRYQSPNPVGINVSRPNFTQPAYPNSVARAQ